MKLVATYNARGPFAGMVVPLRHIEGAHRWVVRIAITIDGVKDEHTIEASEPVTLHVLRPTVFESFYEMLDGRDMVTDATMKFFIK